jgi:hypothetical protein
MNKEIFKRILLDSDVEKLDVPMQLKDISDAEQTSVLTQIGEQELVTVGTKLYIKQNGELKPVTNS